MSGDFSAEARLIHAGPPAPGSAGCPPLVPPASTCPRATRGGPGYGRNGKSGWEALEEALGGLEDAQAVAFASGQAASMALMLTLAEGRDRIVLPADGYYGAACSRTSCGRMAPSRSTSTWGTWPRWRAS